MTGKERPVGDEEFGRVSRKTWELLRRIKEKTLGVEATERELQKIIEGSPSVNPEELRKQAAKGHGYHRHKNGGGWVSDRAWVDAGSFVGPEAIVDGDVVVRSGGNLHLEDSAILSGDNITISGKLQMSENSFLFGKIWILSEGEVVLMDQVQIGGRDNVMLCGKIVIRGNGTLVLKGYYEDGRWVIE